MCQRQGRELDACGVYGRDNAVCAALKCYLSKGGQDTLYHSLTKLPQICTKAKNGWGPGTEQPPFSWSEQKPGLNVSCGRWRILSLSSSAWAAHPNFLFWEQLGKVFKRKLSKYTHSFFKNVLNLDKNLLLLTKWEPSPLLILLFYLQPRDHQSYTMATILWTIHDVPAHLSFLGDQPSSPPTSITSIN